MRRPAREQARLDAVRRAQLIAAAIALRDRTAGVGPEVPVVVVPAAGGVAFPMRVIPAASPRTTPLPRHRRRAFRAHVRRTAAGALAGIDDGVAPRPVPEISRGEGALLGMACGLCGGRCCRRGGDNAYLSHATLRRWLDAHPTAGVKGAVDAYTQCLPSESVEGSCVYHAANGCTLPRNARSATCNAFLCEGLVELRRAYAEGARALFVGVADESGVGRGATVQ